MKAILLLPLAITFQLVAADERATTPVLVELFTSEGCSSCPPADKLLQALDQRQPVKGVQIIVLSEHVDYFDGEGWRDPFGSFQYTARQREYEAALKVDNVFTPQMVVNGKTGFIGNKPELALQEIAKQVGRPLAGVHISQVSTDGPALVASLSIDNIPAEAGKGPFDVLVAVTESGLNSKPDTGENRGVALSHAGVVRNLTKAGKATSSGFQGDFKVKLDHAWKRDSLKIVAFMQDHKTRVVWGVAQAGL